MENYQRLFPSSSRDVASGYKNIEIMSPNNSFNLTNHVDHQNTTTNIGLSVSRTDHDRSMNMINKEHNMSDNNNNKSLSPGIVAIKKGEKKIRRPKFAFETRSQVDILDDGYRWRKYGQKAVKNNKFPRSYYRCTHQGCNVKKQVQRLTKDEEVVITTYEGMHSHPIEKHNDNFEHILHQMQIYNPI